MKVLFIIPDGVGIRNYLYSDVITHLKEKADIAFWSPLAKEAFDEILSLHQIRAQIEKIDLPVETAYTRLFREAATYARLIYNADKVKNETILTNWVKKNKSFKLKLLYTIAEMLGSKASKNYDSILRLEAKSEQHWPKHIIEKYKEKLQTLNPTTIFITHQRVSGIMPICIAAKELGIKVVTAIYSWDNVPKARLAVKADKYIVWSGWMQDEMQTYYPHIDKEQIRICGTPQFDFYFQENRRISRTEFAKRYNLDENKKWICFSGNDKMTCPYDAEYLDDVISGVKIIPLAERPEIIFRRSPADFSNRYDAVINAHKGVVKSIDPIWHNKGNNWGSFFSKVADVDMLVNITCHCDLVINLGSTMAHDFAIYNKPCLYIKYDQPNAKDWSVKTVYQFQHFKTMEHLDAVGFVYHANEWASKITLALQQPNLVGPDRKRWLERIIQHPIENSSKLVAEEIL